MAYTAPDQHGNAEYRSWAQIPNSYALGEETDDTIDYKNRKYARIVYALTPVFAKVIETDGTANLSWTAESAPGSALSASVWRIYQTQVSGNTTSVLWADGNAEFDNIATTPLSALTYS